jgi:hypothetical protein
MKLATRKAKAVKLCGDCPSNAAVMSSSAGYSRLDLNYIKGGEDFTRQSEGPQHPVRNSRARHVRDSEWHFVSRLFRASGATLPFY